MYIFALLRFVSQNRDHFVTNSEIHNINTRQRHDLYLPLPNLIKYQTAVFYRGITLFNGLPDFLKKESFNQKKIFTVSKELPLFKLVLFFGWILQILIVGSEYLSYLHKLDRDKFNRSRCNRSRCSMTYVQFLYYFVCPFLLTVFVNNFFTVQFLLLSITVYVM
jgi:hypothetical protein